MEALTIRFVNCDRSPALETYAEDHLHRLMKRLERRPGRSKSIEIQFRQDARTPEGEMTSGEVTLTYRYPGIHRPLIVKKHGADLRSTLIDAIHSAENSIQKATEKSESGRRTLGHSKRHIRDLRRQEESPLSPPALP